MAGTVEHLAVALELIRRWTGNVPQEQRLLHPQRFLLGNVCPDGIMSRRNYERSMKMHTHFRDGIPDYEFCLPRNLELFHQRLYRFAQETLTDSSPERELYLGYLTHILADEIFMRTVRQEFMQKISVVGLTERDAETFEHFTYDVNQIDFRLAREYPAMDWAYRCLREAEPYEIQGLLTERELTDSRKWLLDFFFDHAPEPQEPVYYTYDRALRYIEDAVAFIDGHIGEYI